MTPLVSILIPAYNAERWLAETIGSALSQTWPRKEIIIVDDGSTDQTLAIARRFASSGIAVVTQANQGGAAARNKALELCQGDYIQWLDADDLLGPDKIATQLHSLDRGGTARTLLASAWGEFILRPQRARFAPNALWEDLTPAEWLLRRMEQGIYIQTTAWLVSRGLTEAAGPWDVRLWVNNDGEYFSRVVAASDQVRFVPGARAFYRNPGFSRVSYVGRSQRKIKAHFLSIQLCIRHLLALDSGERARKACLAFLQRYMIYFYPEQEAILREAEKLAAELGGSLSAPTLSWKYAWIRPLCGWQVAKQARLVFPRFRWQLSNTLEHLLVRWDPPVNLATPTPKVLECRSH